MIIWISLAAVVLIIVVIGVLFRLFLRADDVDPFDELPEEPRRPSRAADEPRPREPVGAASARRPQSRPAPAADKARPADRMRGPQDRRPAERRDSGSNRRPAPAPAASARSPQARAAESAPQASKWDKMSDVDYWTELKSVDSQPTSASPVVPPAADPLSPAPGRRRAPEPVAGARAASNGDQTVQLPVRQRSSRGGSSRNGSPGNGSAPRSRPAEYGQPTGSRPAHSPGRYANGAPEPVTESIAALARLGSQAPARPRPAARPTPAALDDDPLTSPSFPAINDSDSRSYRSRRHDSQPRSIPPGPSYSEPVQQFGAYPPAPDRTISPPNGYPVQSAPPAGNPYGSFVSQPAASQPAASYSPPPPAPASYGKHAQPNADWYDGQAPAPAFTGGSQPGYSTSQQSFSADPAGYQLGYQGGQPDPSAYGQPGYAAAPTPQYDPRLYGSQEPGYGRDGYQGYPGYGSSNY
jgi:hypothetical protein